MTVLNHLGNPAYGLTADHMAPWELLAECGKHDPDLWHAREGGLNVQQIGEARHICLHHCPVREQCARDIGPMRGAIVGGVFYNQYSEQSSCQPLAERCRICRPKKAT